MTTTRANDRLWTELDQVAEHVGGRSFDRRMAPVHAEILRMPESRTRTALIGRVNDLNDADFARKS